MGAKNSKNKKDQIHPLLGPVEIVETQGARKILKSFVIKSADEFQSYRQLVAEIDSYNQKYLFLPSDLKKEWVGICGTTGYVKVSLFLITRYQAAYPYYFHSLETEIKDRQLTVRDFKEVQIWYLLECLSNIGKSFEKSNKRIGDITPKNILMNEDGDIKVFSQFSAPPQQLSSLRPFQNGDSRYYSQESLQELSKNSHPLINRDSRTEVYYTGITLLQTCIMDKIYHKGNSIDDETQLNDLKYQVYSKYSPLLGYLIEKMTAFSTQQRPYFSQINALLLPYRQQILKLESFSIDLNTVADSLRKYSKTNTGLVSDTFRDLQNQVAFFSKRAWRPSTFGTAVNGLSKIGISENSEIPRLPSTLSADSNFTFGANESLRLTNSPTQKISIYQQDNQYADVAYTNPHLQANSNNMFPVHMQYLNRPLKISSPTKPILPEQDYRSKIIVPQQIKALGGTFANIGAPRSSQQLSLVVFNYENRR